MSKDKIIRISEEMHEKLQEIGKGESFNETISKLLEDALFWRKFRIDFLMKIIFHAEEKPDDTIAYGELKDFFMGFLGKYHYAKIMQWLEEAGYE
jgi:predicted CopG family antitoxin